MEPSGTPILQCQNCQTPILPSAAFCARCGSPVVGQAAAQPAQSEPERSSFWVPIKLLVVPLAAVFVTFVAERNAPPGEAIGYWFGLQLIPLLVASIVVRFKPRRKMRTFSTLFCCVGLVGLFLTFIGSVPQRLAHHEKTPQEIVREAVGTKPIEDTGDPSDQAFSRMIRGFMNDMIAARKKHDRDAAALQPALDTLYTSKSFEPGNTFKT